MEKKKGEECYWQLSQAYMYMNNQWNLDVMKSPTSQDAFQPIPG